MEEKVKITLPEEEIVDVEFNGEIIKVKTFITLEDYENILNDVLSTVISNSDIENKVYILRIRTVRDIVELCTNIDVTELPLLAFDEDGDIWEFVSQYIRNCWAVVGAIDEEYKIYHMKECFGILAKKVPSAKQMEKSMNNIKDAINGMDSEKLDMVAKSIVWNNMPALGNNVAPAEHIKTDK